MRVVNGALLFAVAFATAWVASIAAPVRAQPVIVTPIGDLAPLSSQAAADNFFGYSVSTAGGAVIVGAPERDVSGDINAGTAFVFDLDGSGRRALTPTGGRRDESQFGYAVAIDGGTAIVAATYEHFAATSFTEEGAVYVFTRDALGNWTQSQRLTAGGAASPGDNFGTSVDLEGNTLAIGAAGRNTSQGIVYLFTRPDETSPFSQVDTVEAPTGDASTRRGFGNAVALDGDGLLVGQFNGFNTMPETAHVFRADAGSSSWAHEATLSATDGAVGDRFGLAVALRGSVALVGSPNAGSGGAVYVFTEEPAGTWTQLQKLTVSGSGAFGGSIALADDFALIGASTTTRSGRSRAGAAHVFLRDPGTGAYSAEAVLPASAPEANDAFGFSVDLDGPDAAIGAPFESLFSLNDGHAFTFSIKLANGAPCGGPTSARVCESSFCVDGVCCNLACDGGCNACSVAGGAATDGTCEVLGSGVECRPAADSCDLAEVCDGTAAECPADERMAVCDAGPMPMEDSSVPPPEDGGGGTDAGVPGTTVPRRELSCTCRTAGGDGGGSSLPLLALGLLGGLLLSRSAGRRSRTR